MRRHAGQHRRDSRILEQVVSALFLLSIPALSAARPVLEYERGLATGSPVVRPNCVTVGFDSPSVCVTDEASRTLDVFDAYGFHLFRTDLSSGIFAPVDGSIDSDGRFLYIETGGREPQTIRRLNFLGEPEAYTPESPSAGWEPIHLCLSRDGNYISIDGDGTLTKHDSATGAVIWTLSLIEPGFERADLTGRPTEGADGTIYVPLTGYKQVAAVTPDGQLDSMFGVSGTKPGELAFPIGVAETPSGEILVLDRMRHAVLIYSQDHKFLGESGRIGEGLGDFYHPVAIAASVDGRVYIAQGFEGRVQQYRLTDSGLSRKSSGS